MFENVRQISYSETQKCQSGPRRRKFSRSRLRTWRLADRFDDHGSGEARAPIGRFDHTRQQQTFTRRYEQNGPILRGQERFTFRQESG